MSRDRYAFTLFDLLVVITIIALLIGILVPAFGAANESAKREASLVTLRFERRPATFQMSWPMDIFINGLKVGRVYNARTKTLKFEAVPSGLNTIQVEVVPPIAANRLSAEYRFVAYPGAKLYAKSDYFKDTSGEENFRITVVTEKEGAMPKPAQPKPLVGVDDVTVSPSGSDWWSLPSFGVYAGVGCFTLALLTYCGKRDSQSS